MLYQQFHCTLNWLRWWPLFCFKLALNKVTWEDIIAASLWRCCCCCSSQSPSGYALGQTHKLELYFSTLPSREFQPWIKAIALVCIRKTLPITMNQICPQQIGLFLQHASNRRIKTICPEAKKKCFQSHATVTIGQWIRADLAWGIQGSFPCTGTGKYEFVSRSNSLSKKIDC